MGGGKGRKVNWKGKGGKERLKAEKVGCAQDEVSTAAHVTRGVFFLKKKYCEEWYEVYHTRYITG